VNQSLQTVNEGNKLAGQIMLGVGVALALVGWGCRGIGRAIGPRAE
jgi:hypothetical protein